MRIALVTNPVDDLGFRSVAEAYLVDGASSPGFLQDRLRRDYPRATVTDGIADRGTMRWYAYRDGRWIKPSTPREG